MDIARNVISMARQTRRRVAPLRKISNNKHDDWSRVAWEFNADETTKGLGVDISYMPYIATVFPHHRHHDDPALGRRVAAIRRRKNMVYIEDRQLGEAIEWCEENCRDHYTINAKLTRDALRAVHFADVVDAVYFKLRFVG